MVVMVEIVGGVLSAESMQLCMYPMLANCEHQLIC